MSRQIRQIPPRSDLINAFNSIPSITREISSHNVTSSYIAVFIIMMPCSLNSIELSIYHGCRYSTLLSANSQYLLYCFLLCHTSLDSTFQPFTIIPLLSLLDPNNVKGRAKTAGGGSQVEESRDPSRKEGVKRMETRYTAAQATVFFLKIGSLIEE